MLQELCWRYVRLSEFESEIRNPITPEIARRRKELTAEVNNNSINLEESKELKTILDEEAKEAQSEGNWVVALAIVALIGVVVAILAALSRNE